MFSINIEKKYTDFVKKQLFVTKESNEMVVKNSEKNELFRIDCPKDLDESFDLVPEKRGYITKNDKGELTFTLVRFVDYHNHSEFSLLDGANKISDVVAKSEGCSAVTDHGVMFGTLQFYKAMLAAGKKPIVGVEVYAESMDGEKEADHMILLIKNMQGYRNICKIISEAEINFYRKPQVSYDMLEKYHEGLICTSACLGGEIPTEIMKQHIDKASEVAEILQGIFGDDFYLEIQYHNIGSEEEVVNNVLFDIAELNDIKVLGAIDAHYTNEDDEYAHEILLSIGTKKTISDPKRYKFTGDGYHLHTAEEFEEKFKDIPELIANTLEIYDKCNFDFELGIQKSPKFLIPDGFKSEEEYFEHQCLEGFKERFEGTAQYTDRGYIDRLNYEIKQIKATGYTGYFCIVQEYVLFAKEHNIFVGPGRGSCVGSLVAYCLKITELDPIPYGLLFER